MKSIGFIGLFSLVILSGCSRTTISPQCNFTNFTRNDELNQIKIAVQLNDTRKDSERCFLQAGIFRMWEENSMRFKDSQFYQLNKPSKQLLQESLSKAFSEYGYNVLSDSSVVINCEQLKFFYTALAYIGNNQPKALAIIEIKLSIQKDGKSILNKTCCKMAVQPFNGFRQFEEAEPLLSRCLTEFVYSIVLDKEIENSLKKVYKIPVPEEQVNVPQITEQPKPQDSSKQEKLDLIITTGTGFAICENGYIVTANHVIDNANSVLVKFQENEWLPAKIIRKSIINDVAILKVDENLKYYLSISNKIKQGEKIFTLGYPVPELLGEEPKYAEGTVSSLTGIVDEASLMQISIPLQPGNSGGPLLNENAEAVGMATSVAKVESFYRATGTLPQNVNWGVKSDFIKPLLPNDCINDLPDINTDIDPVDVARNAVCLIKVEKPR